MRWKITLALLTILASGYWAGYQHGHQDGELTGYLKGTYDMFVNSLTKRMK